MVSKILNTITVLTSAILRLVGWSQSASDQPSPYQPTVLISGVLFCDPMLSSEEAKIKLAFFSIRSVSIFQLSKVAYGCLCLLKFLFWFWPYNVKKPSVLLEL